MVLGAQGVNLWIYVLHDATRRLRTEMVHLEHAKWFPYVSCMLSDHVKVSSVICVLLACWRSLDWLDLFAGEELRFDCFGRHLENS